MYELNPTKTPKFLMVKDLSNLYKLDDRFNGIITDDFRKFFTKLFSFIVYDSVINSKEIHITEREDSVIFKLNRFEYNQLLSLRKGNYYRDIDIVMYQFGYELECSYSRGSEQYKRIVYSKRIEKYIVDRINNGEQLYPKDIIYAKDYLKRLQYFYNYKKSNKQLLEYINIFNMVMSFLIKQQFNCRFKSVHLYQNAYISIISPFINEHFTKKKKSIEAKVKLLYNNTDLQENDIYFFSIGRKDFDKYYKDGIFVYPNTKSLYLYKYFEEAFFSRFNGCIFCIRYNTNNKKTRFSVAIEDTKKAQLLYCKDKLHFKLPEKITIL